MLVSTLLDGLQSEPGRPRLTWYGDDGERVELSGAVLANWVAKTTNLLVEEYDAQPGTNVGVDLPVHWRTVVWALAAWRVGATVVPLPGDGAGDPPDLDVIVSDTPGPWADASADLVAVSLPALARRYDGDLPPGAMDAAAAVMTYADQILFAPRPDPSATALIDAASVGVVGHDALVPPAREGRRELVDGRRPVAVVLRDLLGVWAGAGSAVLTSPSTADALDADPERYERLVNSEKVWRTGA